MKNKNNNQYLFEIGVEEIPASYIEPAMQKMVGYFSDELHKANIKLENIKQFSTPRRFAILISGLPAKQKDQIKEIKGPPKQIAYDDKGNLSKAGKGFLKSKGLEESDLEFVKTNKGLYLTATQKIPGKATEEILKQISLEVINDIAFPKTMRWGIHNISFARPVRWLMAIFNSKLVNFQIDGIDTGKITYANRIEKLRNKVYMPKCSDYENILKQHFVIPDRIQRKSIIKNQIEELFSNKEEQAVKDGKLLNTVTDLVEFPTSAVASFDKKFLKLPKLLIKTTLSEHQKYFAVENTETKLFVNKFVFVSNAYPEQTHNIKYGNERVVNARLSDAAFFFEQDTKKSLDSFIPELKNILFQAKLGSLYDKTQRIVKLTKYVCAKLQIVDEIRYDCVRAAELCKADLASLMLGEKEFTKLQGYIGSVYAQKSGENKQVVQAIRHQYDYEKNKLEKIPFSAAILSLADNLDTVSGIIGAGMIPTGSKDPFALRRAANVVVQLLFLKKFELNLNEIINKSFEILSDKLSEDENRNNVEKFFADRIKWNLKEKDIDYDVADAVMESGFNNIPDLFIRANNLQKFKSKQDFKDLIIGFKRATNILEKSKQKLDLKTDNLIEEEEKELYEKFLDIKPNYLEALENKNYRKCFNLLVELRDFIDLFFDNVMVMVENKDICENRMALLRKINESFLRIADLSKIVYEGE